MTTQQIPKPDYKPYLVYHRDRYDEDERHVVRVPSAMGPYDAKNQSLIEPEHWGCSAVREEVWGDA